MKIIRNNEEIELTMDEVFEAHKEFVTSFMIFLKPMLTH